MEQVLIKSQEVAAITTAWELAARGFSVIMAGHRKHRFLPLVLEEHTIALIDSIYGIRLHHDSRVHLLDRREIRGWDSSSGVVDSKALSVSWSSLIDILRSRLKQCFATSVTWSSTSSETENAIEFAIEATGYNQNGLSFGQRVATLATVETHDRLSRCVIERTCFGWAFLVLHGNRQATLFAFAADRKFDEEQVMNSTVSDYFATENLVLRENASAWRSCSPTLSHPLVTNQQILVGESAFTLDPICGDGVGYAVRSAVLAATVVADRSQAEFRGHTYYVARLRRAFSAHLTGCANVYAGWANGCWGNELSATQRGVAYLSHQNMVHQSGKSIRRDQSREPFTDLSMPTL